MPPIYYPKSHEGFLFASIALSATSFGSTGRLSSEVEKKIRLVKILLKHDYIFCFDVPVYVKDIHYDPLNKGNINIFTRFYYDSANY